MERCNIVNECLLSKVKVENYNNLLIQVKELFKQEDIEPISTLHKHKNSLNKLSAETLRGIAHKPLASIGVDARRSCFRDDLLKHPKSRRCELDPTVLSMRDKATARRHDWITKDKRQREEYEDMVEVAISKKKRIGR